MLLVCLRYFYRSLVLLLSLLLLSASLSLVTCYLQDKYKTNLSFDICSIKSFDNEIRIHRRKTISQHSEKKKEFCGKLRCNMKSSKFAAQSLQIGIGNQIKNDNKTNVGSDKQTYVLQRLMLPLNDF